MKAKTLLFAMVRRIRSSRSIEYELKHSIAKLSELCIDAMRVLADANQYKTWKAARLARVREQLDGQITQALAMLAPCRYFIFCI